MSGHSKWSTIKNKKEKADKARSKIFTKIGKELAVAVKIGKEKDPEKNSRLKDAILKAKANNFPNENIERIVKKAMGDIEKKDFFSINYEGYGPEGVAVFVEVLTDNKNRTASNVRYYFDKFGGKLGSLGCVSYLFNKKGVVFLSLKNKTEEELMEDCLNFSALDFKVFEDFAKVIVSCKGLNSFVEKLREKSYEILSAKIEQVAENFVEISLKENKDKFKMLVENLKADEDVVEVWTNFKDFELI